MAFIHIPSAFCFNDRSDTHPSVPSKKGEWREIVVMGDDMVSLLTSWAGVQDYQCQEFMHVFRWLLK